MEIHRAAAGKAIKGLSEYHTYEDGGIDQPFINSDTIKEEDLNNGNN